MRRPIFDCPCLLLKVFSPTLDAEMLALLRRSLLEKHIVTKPPERYARAQCVGYLKKWLHLAMLENPSLATWSSERKGVADLKRSAVPRTQGKDARLRKLTAMFVGADAGNSVMSSSGRRRQQVCCFIVADARAGAMASA